MTQGALDLGTEEASWIAELEAHLPVIGRVCMALLGEKEAAERAVERVARDTGERGIPADVPPRVFLLGLAHRACTTQLSRLPMRRSTQAYESKPSVLTKLKPTEREALVMHLVGGLDPAEIAQACGIDESAVRTRIGTGLSVLAKGEPK